MSRSRITLSLVFPLRAWVIEWTDIVHQQQSRYGLIYLLLATQTYYRSRPLATFAKWTGKNLQYIDRRPLLMAVWHRWTTNGRRRLELCLTETELSLPLSRPPTQQALPRHTWGTPRKMITALLPSSDWHMWPYPLVQILKMVSPTEQLFLHSLQ